MRVLKESFNAGEFTPRLHSRYELAKYKNGCKTLTNFVPLPQGPVTRRPGTEYISAVKTAAKYTRLIPFEFSEDDSYIIELGHLYARFYMNGGQVLTADADTVLLLHSDGIDNSTTITDSGATVHTVTAVGDAKLKTGVKKFGSASLYLDGAGDYCTLPDNADFNFAGDEFTIDFWLRPSANGINAIYSQEDAASVHDHVLLFYDLASDTIYFSVWDSAARVTLQKATSAGLVADTWAHIALVRGWGSVTNDWAICVNGAAVSTFTAAITMPDHDQVISIGDFGSTTKLVDLGGTGHQAAFSGNTVLSTSASKFGKGSLYFDGSADYIVVPDHDDFDISANWTIDFFVKHSDHVGVECYACQFEDANNFWIFTHTHGSGLRFLIGSGGVDIIILGGGGAYEITDTNWHHIAVCKVGDEWGIYNDGAIVAYLDDNSAMDTFAGNLHFGERDAASQGVPFQGYMSNIRIQASNVFSAAPDSGLADTITVPTTYSVPDANTKVLLHCEQMYASGYIDEYRVSTTNRWTANFAPPTSAYPYADDSGAVYEVATTYIEEDLPNLHFVQSADTMYIVHKDYVVRTLTRSGHASWAIADVSFTDAPAAWSAGDYPRTVEFFEDRLVFGGSPDQPDTIWTSHTSAYHTFTVGDASEEKAITLTLLARKVNDIQWLSSGRRLIAGTRGEEWWAAGPSDTEPMTPADHVARRDSSWGSERVMPVNIGDVIFYVQQGGSTIRELIYDFQKDKYVSSDLNVLAEHLTRDYSITAMAYQQHPYQVLWCVRSDGTVLALTYLKEHEVFGWSKHTFGGTDVEVESVAVIPGDPEDEVWFVVKRTINSATARYVEKLKDFNYGTALEDAFFMDSGLTYEGAAATAISGLSHLEGEAVTVLADGLVVTGHTVASGAITLATAASKVHIGLANTPEFETLDAVTQDNEGTLQGILKRITNVTMRLVNSMGGLFGPDSTVTDPILYDDETEPYTGWTKDLSFDEGDDQTSTVYITCDEPLPLEIAAIMIELED